MKNLDKYRGCLVGGACGDALGYMVEFLDVATIFEKYGEQGITEYRLFNGVAEISDDTQMTLFTANGLLYGKTRGQMRGIMGAYPSYISLAYRDWLCTQMEEYPLKKAMPGINNISWLLNIPELFARRAPGNTCLSAIRSNNEGTIEKPINNSKGCGSVMRVAPVGLFFTEDKYKIDEIDMIGAEVGALTHGHELGYIPAAALVHIINLVSHSDEINLLDAVKDAVNAMPRLFPDAKHMDEFVSLMEKAISLSECEMDDLDAIRQLGEGWVAEEALAIAVYCALKYSNNFEKALIAAVNHDGDSDSTGAVTGNILGAYLGMSNIPEKLINNLELKDVILEIADDLYSDCRISEYSEYEDPIWERKYIYCNYDCNRNLDSTYVKCEQFVHAFEFEDYITGGSCYVCRKCGAVRHVSILPYFGSEVNKEQEVKDEFEYVDLDQDKTIQFFRDTIELTIESTGQLFKIQKAQFEVGRGSSCELKFDSSNTKISSNHATIYYRDQQWYVKDNSSNGTWINGTRLVPGKKYLLYENDVIDFAHSEKVTFFKTKNQSAAYSKKNLVGGIIRDKYIVLRSISTGINFDIYLVLDKEKKEQYALKVCDKWNKSIRPEVHELMWLETSALMELNHPAIPKLIEALENDRFIFIIREYIDGNSLNELVEKNGPQSPENVIEWAKQLCGVLQYLHSDKTRYIHRDINPRNIILGPEGKVKLIDFGIAMRYEAGSKNANSFFDSKEYAESERAFPLTKEDTSFDIYGLGMTMHYLLTGEKTKNSSFTVKPIREINPELPKQLEVIISKCIEPNPENRYQSCNDVLKALEGEFMYDIG